MGRWGSGTGRLGSTGLFIGIFVRLMLLMAAMGDSSAAEVPSARQCFPDPLVENNWDNTRGFPGEGPSGEPISNEPAGLQDQPVVHDGSNEAAIAHDMHDCRNPIPVISDAGLTEKGPRDGRLRDAGLREEGPVDGRLRDAGLREEGPHDSRLRDAGLCARTRDLFAEEADEDDPVDQEHRFLQAFAEEADEDEPVDQEQWCIQEEAAAVSRTFFRPAKTFSTPPTGCVYKRGNKGLGFYCDDQRQVISLNDLVPGGPSGVAPLRLTLDHVIPSGDGDVDVEGIPEETGKLSKKQKQRLLQHERDRKLMEEADGTAADGKPESGRPPTTARKTRPCTRQGQEQCRRKELPKDDRDDPRWPDDGSLAASCKLHVKAGLWAVDTFNANAWTGAARYLKCTAADFVLGQEAKIEADEKKEVEDSLKNDGWQVAIQPCNSAQRGGKSAGTIIGTRKHIGLGNAKCTTDEWPELRGRFQVKVAGAVCKGGLPLCTLLAQQSWSQGQGEPRPPPRNGSRHQAARRGVDTGR